MKNLIIVESPTKARTIGRFLGKDYEIMASMGHLMDLPKSKLGVAVEKNFEPLYELVGDKKKIVDELRQQAKNADTVLLATDPDREGEAIAFHVSELLSHATHKHMQRIVFHEITKEAVEEALQHPRSIDTHLVDAQTARRVLDRLVGYKLSPLLWKKVRRGLSAGRVQSVALRLIVEREKEIEQFTKEQYYTVVALLNQGSVSSLSVQFELVEKNGQKIEEQKTYELYDGQYKVSKTTISTENDAQNIVNDIGKNDFIVSDVLQKETKRSPQPPYTTSTLQQDAARRLGFSGKRTMSIAQKLYEEGYITYHRTDSFAIASSAQQAIIGYVKKEYGEKYVPEKPRFYTIKQKLAQEAHEAIRPTKASNQPSAILRQGSGQVSDQLGRDFGRLYELIWRRAVASQMADAIIESTTVITNVNGAKDTYRFKANGSVLVFEGFLKINPQALQDNRLPAFKTGEKLTAEQVMCEYHETPLPPRYNDASLIKTLEEKGIGRPSTYATIVGTIQDRQYIERGDPVTGLGRAFTPTPIGIAVNDFLVANFSDIDDIPFTAQMEDELDSIAHGQKEWAPVIKAFYEPFEKKLGTVENAQRVKIPVEETNETCPECQSPLVIRTGRFGKFLSCSRFPECKFSKQFVEETGVLCPKDGSLPAGRQGKVIVRKTKKGRKFFGCSNYPKCDFASWKLEDVKKALTLETTK